MGSQGRFGLVAALAFAVPLLAVSRVEGQQFELLHSFAGCPPEGCGTTGDAAHPDASPGATIAGPDGNVYGISLPSSELTTPYPWGTVFRVSAGSGALTILHRFPGAGPGGCGPGGIGFNASGMLYVLGRGCVTADGAAARPAIFRLIDGNAELVQEFTPYQTPGLHPVDMVASTTGNLYLAAYDGFLGPTETYGWNDTNGTLTLLPWGKGLRPMRPLADGHVYVRDSNCFWNPATNVFSCLWDKLIRLDDAAEISLPYEDPVGPGGTLANDIFLAGPDGNLYGSVHQLGTHRMYRLTPDGNYTFLPGSEGLWPLGFGPDGSIYGISDFVFTANVISRLTGGVQVPVHAFEGLDGAGAFSQLVRGADGHLYGLRRDGGTHGLGVLYRVRMPRVDMRANGADGPVTVSARQPLTIAMGFDAASDAVNPSEVYLAVVTPALQVIWTTPSGFSLSPAPIYSGPLPSFASTPLINIPDVAVMPSGDYYWVAIVDADSNGVPNGDYVDVVKTTKATSTLRMQRR